MKEFLSSNRVQFAYLDISENLFNLKTFLKYRDTLTEFEQIKREGRVGVPCLVVNDGEEVIFEKEKYDFERLLQQA